MENHHDHCIKTYTRRCGGTTKDINLAIPDSLNALVLKCMAKEATDRYANVKELMMGFTKLK